MTTQQNQRSGITLARFAAATLACIAWMGATGNAAYASEPVLIDLRPVLNTAWEDDGIPGNMAGGWTDEGVNDMYLWPPLTAGKGSIHGFPFDLVDPAKNAGKGVLLLSGKKGRWDLPEKVEVRVAHATGRYLYLLMNAALPVTGWQRGSETNPNPVALTVTLRYADGTMHDFPLREGIEIAQWKTTLIKPLHASPLLSLVHLGENLVQNGAARAGVWATRLENPAPEQPVVGLYFQSSTNGLSVPCIFAATLSDADYSSAAICPAPTKDKPPAGYFDAKSKARDAALYLQMRCSGYIKGARESTVLRPDLVAITFDNALTRDLGNKTNTTLLFHEPVRWMITSPDDPAYHEGKHPLEVGHKGFERYMGNLLPGQNAVNLYWNEFYLRFPTPMQSGWHYRMTVDGIETGRFDRIDFVSTPPRKRTVVPNGVSLTNHVEFAYDDHNTITRALKVNQVGYSLSGKDRWAYLGWWAGSLGPVDYAAFPAFEVVDESSGKSVLQGKVELRAPGRELHIGDVGTTNMPEGNLKMLPPRGKSELGATTDEPSGEIVYQLDLSKLAAGHYHLVVPGLGRSEAFRIGADATAEAAYHTFRAFLYQRCGQELGPPNAPQRIKETACHTQCWESGYLVGNPAYTPKPGEARRSFSGGYHDAADMDVFALHLEAIADALMVYECDPKFFTDGQFNLPESGKGIPDILSEAKWALKFWLENQLENGSVPWGRGNDCDSWGQTLGCANWTQILDPPTNRRPFGILPPTPESSPVYAAVAAQVSTRMRPYDKDLADRLIASARRALDYALLEKEEPYPVRLDPKTKQAVLNKPDYVNIVYALGECYRATGDPKLAEKLATFYPYVKKQPHRAWSARSLWPLLHCPYPIPPEIAADARKILLDDADGAVRRTYLPAYRMGNGNYDDPVSAMWASIGWGLSMPGHFVAPLVYAHALTGETKYLDALALNYDFLFGVNPMGKSFVCGIGWNPPRRPEIAIWFYQTPAGEYIWHSPSLALPVITGITVYGLAGEVPYYPTEKDSGGPWPLMHCHRDVDRGQETYNEFTIHQTVGPTALMTLYLASRDHALAAKQP